jgi:hypothetical protein
MNFSKLSSKDYMILFLSTLFFLHGSSFIAFHTPASLWAVIVTGLFLLLAHSCSKTTNWLSYLFPIAIIDVIWKIAKIPSIYDPIAFAQFLSSFMQFAILPLLTYYLFKKNNLRVVRYVFFIYCIVEITTGISTIMACANDPTLARMDYGTMREENPALYAYRMNLNVGDYHTSYGFTAMLPIAILFLKWAGNFPREFLSKMLSFLICVVMVYTVYSASYTMSLSVCGLMLLIFLCPPKISKSYFYSSLIAVLISAYLLRLTIPLFLEIVADYLNNDVMSIRLHDLADSIAGGKNNSDTDSDFNLRMNTYEKSWMSFLSNPIFGSWSYNASGGHSYILDNLGLMGIMGVGIIINMWKSIWNRYIGIYKAYPWFYYYCYALIAIVIFFFVNPSGMSEQLLFFYPISGYILANYTHPNSV